MRHPDDAPGAFARFDAGWALFLLEADGRFAPNAIGWSFFPDREN